MSKLRSTLATHVSNERAQNVDVEAQALGDAGRVRGMRVELAADVGMLVDHRRPFLVRLCIELAACAQ